MSRRATGSKECRIQNRELRMQKVGTHRQGSTHRTGSGVFFGQTVQPQSHGSAEKDSRPLCRAPLCRFRPLCGFIALFVTFALNVAAQAERASNGDAKFDRLVLLDGTTLQAAVTAIDEAGLLQLADRADRVPLANIWQISRASVKASKPVAPPKSIEVTLIDGSRLVTTDLAADGDEFQLTWTYPSPVNLPVASLRAVRFNRNVSGKQLEQAARTSSDTDTLFVMMDGKATSLQGFFDKLDADQITFQWRDRTRKLPRRELNGLVLAAVEEAPDNTSRCRIQLANGSTLWAAVESLTDGLLNIALAGDSKLALPWTAVVKMTVNSPRMVFLSDLEPRTVHEEAIATFNRPWQRDVSVAGQPLTLGKRHFEKGLGVHARSLLVFDNSAGYDLFVATIGIDAETKGRGDCIFVVRGDGRELFRGRVRGQDKPRDVRVDIQQVRQLTLLVEPGAELDLADHADWCDARLVRVR
jgi:hypothetical protein